MGGEDTGGVPGQGNNLLIYHTPHDNMCHFVQVKIAWLKLFKILATGMRAGGRSILRDIKEREEIQNKDKYRAMHQAMKQS